MRNTYRSSSTAMAALNDKSAGGPDSTADREFVHFRLVEAPRERVFKAFSDPARLARWWGPHGFGSTFHEFDLRPGGAWRFVMHGPDGANYPNQSVFVGIHGRTGFRRLAPPS